MALPRLWSIASPCWMSFRPGACGQRPQTRAWVSVLTPLSSAYLSTEYKDVVSFALLILVLLVMPTGILGRPEVEKV